MCKTIICCEISSEYGLFRNLVALLSKCDVVNAHRSLIIFCIFDLRWLICWFWSFEFCIFAISCWNYFSKLIMFNLLDQLYERCDNKIEMSDIFGTFLKKDWLFILTN